MPFGQSLPLLPYIGVTLGLGGGGFHTPSLQTKTPTLSKSIIIVEQKKYIYTTGRGRGGGEEGEKGAKCFLKKKEEDE